MPNILSQLASFDPRFDMAYVGEYEACIFLQFADRQDVDDLIPGPLKPGPQHIAPINKHPVLIFVGRQSHVRPESADPSMCEVFGDTPLCMNYLEAIVAVPFVQRENTNGQPATDFVFSTVLYLDSHLPTFLGWLCGFPKKVGSLQNSQQSWQVETSNAAPLLSAQFEFADGSPDVDDPDAWKSPFCFGGYRDAMHAIFQQAHLGRLMDLPGDFFDLYVSAKLDFRMDRAKIRPIRIQGALTDTFCEIVPDSFDMPPLDDESAGAFALRASWRLEPPKHYPV